MARTALKGPEARVATVPEFARIMRISRGSAFAAVKRGDVRSVRLGKRILIPLEAIEELLEAQ